jgi:hypothetical protein
MKHWDCITEFSDFIITGFEKYLRIFTDSHKTHRSKTNTNCEEWLMELVKSQSALIFLFKDR